MSTITVGTATAVPGESATGRIEVTAMAGGASPGTRGVTYRRDVWHHGMVVLDRPARFAVLMWRRRDGTDDVFADLPAPVELRL